MRSRSRIVVACLAGAVFIGGLVSCGAQPKAETVDYLVDATIPNYNFAVQDAQDGAMALARVIPGFIYQSPSGSNQFDTDIGTVTVVDPRKTVKYAFARGARYSDKVQMTCDDLVLAWIAQSGKYRAFTPATTAGYRDITGIDCKTGATEALVTFKAGTVTTELFGAGTLLPSHIASAAAGTKRPSELVAQNDSAGMSKLANFWNTGWKLTPGKFVEKNFPSAGPYLLSGVNSQGGIELTANESWTGAPAAIAKLTVWPLNETSLKLLADKKIEVMDVALGSTALRAVGGEKAEPVKPIQTLGTERLVFGTRGGVAQFELRKALALCIDRAQLAKKSGTTATQAMLGSTTDGLLNSLAEKFGSAYSKPNIKAAAELVTQIQPSGSSKISFSIGYRGKDLRRAAVVDLITQSCAAAGINIIKKPDSLKIDTVSALLVGDGNRSAASGSDDGSVAAQAYRFGDPANISHYQNAFVTSQIDELARKPLVTHSLGLLRGLFTQLWNDLPALPLFRQQRIVDASPKIATIVPAIGWVGTGWNMDCWKIS